MGSKARTMWVWDTKELLLNRAEKRRFFDFCKAKNIGEIFFQLQLSYKGINTPELICNIEYQNQMRQFLKEANSAHIKVHGLEGHPSYALKEKHPKALAIVRAVIDFNKSSSSEEKFYGVHFDNEPYLLPGFQSIDRKKILLEFLEINKKCADLVHAETDDLVYGIDIPFWFTESVENIDKETTYIISVNGEEKSTSFHLIDICDNVGIMDYRNFASGPDGIIEHGLGELKYADTRGKQIYIGVETSKYPDQRIAFIYGLERSEFRKRFSEIARSLWDGVYFEGFKLRVLDDGVNIHAGLMPGEGFKNKALFREKLLKLARELGRNFYEMGNEEKERLLFDVQWVIKENVEFKGFRRNELKNKEKKELYLILDTEEIMLPKISFAGITEVQFEGTLKEAEKAFSKYSSFHSFAIHYYKSYRALCGE